MGSTGYVVIGLSAGVALYLYNQKPKEKDKSDAWDEGWKTGFLTPGPFTILGLLGLGYVITHR